MVQESDLLRNPGKFFQGVRVKWMELNEKARKVRASIIFLELSDSF